MKTNILTLIVGVLALVGIFFPKSTVVVQEVLGSTVGTTSSTEKIYTVSVDLSTTTPTTIGGACKLYNSDSFDRIITQVKYYFSGVGTFGFNATGVSSLQLNMGTSTGVYLASGNKVLSAAVVATSSPVVYTATTSPGTTSLVPADRVWASGTCLNLTTNATSSTAVGTIGVEVMNN